MRNVLTPALLGLALIVGVGCDATTDYQNQPTPEYPDARPGAEENMEGYPTQPETTPRIPTAPVPGTELRDPPHTDQSPGTPSRTEQPAPPTPVETGQDPESIP